MNRVIAKIDDNEKLIDLYIRNESGYEVLIGVLEKENTEMEGKHLKQKGSKSQIWVDKIEPKKVDYELLYGRK